MNNTETTVARHYGDTGLLSRILDGLAAAGADSDNLQCDDLAPVDEFHIGGRKATTYAVDKMSLRGDEHVLDVGCGIGGAVRYVAAEKGCQVTGIDLTPEFIDTARALTEMVGGVAGTAFDVASALAIPFEAETFDAALTIHVAMNIYDRPALYAEVARVLKPGGRFCMYDVMSLGAGDIAFPVPWAQSPETSHLTTVAETRAHLEGAGFDVVDTDDRTQVAIEFFKENRPTDPSLLPPLGVHLILGPDAPVKFKNTRQNIEAGLIASVVMVAEKRAG